MVASSRALLLLALFSALPPVPAIDARQQQTDRQPAVAGQFYPAGPAELRRTVADLLTAAAARTPQAHPVALIVPHAGYIYSGGVAASGFNQIDPARKYENVFLIGSSHHMAFDGASVYCSGDFITPLGKVTVNRTLGEKLVKSGRLFTANSDPHVPEHSLEVQLPFLQARLKQPFQIVPILLGTGRAETCRKIASLLRPYLNEKNLFVISSDFSHYPAYEAAVRVDRTTADAIMSNSPDVLIRTLQENEEAGIPDLATSLCGWSAVLTLLYMTSQEKDIAYHAVQYRNSGDAIPGGRRGVVGYWAIVAARREPRGHSSFSLSANDRAILLGIARRAIEARVTNGSTPGVVAAGFSEALTAPCGAFVTLTKHGALRGCIGCFEPSGPLYTVVQQTAIASATNDSRFEPVAPAELRDISIEISVLSPMVKIGSVGEIQLGKHGIYLRKGRRSGTFLPKVATDTGWTKEEFLGHCARDKAGIGWDGWKEADLYVFEALVFSEEEISAPQ